MIILSTFVLIISLVSQSLCEYGSECKTPSIGEGICVPIRSCKPAYDYFTRLTQTGGNISDSERLHIQNLHCGTFRGVHHICCDPAEVQLNPDGLSVLQNQKCGIYTTDKVTNGFEARLSGFPWMALLIYDDESNPYKCAGSLISQQHVLTAAHCIRGRESTIIAIRLGEHRKSTTRDCFTLMEQEKCAPPVEDIGIEEFILHSNYRGVYNDIALVRLNRKVEFKEHIKPICLPIYDNLRTKLYERYIISGWGGTETGNSSDVLRIAVVPRVETASCQVQLQPWGLLNELNEQHLCAGGENLVDSCKGDSGGPMGFGDLYNGRPRFIQYGIVSVGLLKCGVENLSGIYVNVSNYLQWITDHMRVE
uniref:CLIP domain-containing serine protease n=1 Tax=Stomoxys calcitrans TaxID=35570 RepID=A0A1I8PZH1_STOCA